MKGTLLTFTIHSYSVLAGAKIYDTWIYIYCFCLDIDIYWCSLPLKTVVGVSANYFPINTWCFQHVVISHSAKQANRPFTTPNLRDDSPHI